MTEDVWMVEAIIQPFKLDAVLLALEELPEFRGVTVSDCRGFGQEKLAGAHDAVSGEARPHRRGGDFIDFTTKLKLEIAVTGKTAADRIVETVARTAHTGRRGDGKVFVWPLTRVVRVRTFEEDVSAL